MKFVQSLFLACLLSLPFQTSLLAEKEGSEKIALKKQTFFSKSVHEVASLGAPITGPLVEGSVGSIPKGHHNRFYCHSTPVKGFLGPQEVAKPISLKDQPGVFPAPLVGEASVSFQFHNQDANASIVPIVIRPDGTVYQGLAMTAEHSPQTLVISSPAQTGIYTLFVLAHEKDSLGAHVTVDASINTQPRRNATFHLKSFEPTDNEVDLISAEFVYIPS